MDAEVLGKMSLFTGLAPRAVNGLAGVFSEQTATSGERIITQGQPSMGVYIVIRGSVEVMRETKTGALIPIHKIEEGELFGTLSTIDGGSRGAHCIARGDVTYAFMQKTDFMELVQANSTMGLGFQVAVIRAIFQDIRETNEQLAELSALEPLEDLTPIS
jgi:CRP/FNR family transcriptional regulator, cyclic AMP receptor protein